MTMWRLVGAHVGWRAAGALLAAAIPTSRLAAAPILSSGHVSIVVASRDSCEVTMELTVVGGREVEHRLERFDGSRVELIATHGSRQSAEMRRIGRTESLSLRPDGAAYGFRYRIWQPPDRVDRCPIWLPTVATDGHPGAVQIEVDLPSGAVPGDTMPTFTWTGTHGSAELANLPSVTRVPYTTGGEPRRWNVTRTMDALAVALFVAASAAWTWRAKR